MFYIVETREQLDKVIAYGNTEVFLDVIPVDDRIHPALNKPSLIYFRPLSAKRGFILVIDHMEGFSLSWEDVKCLLIDKIPLIYTIDKKDLLYYGLKDNAVKSLKMAHALFNNPEFPDISKYNTPAHIYYERKLSNREDINRFIPISKHYEKYENYFDDLDFYPYQYVDESFQFYNDQVTKVFYDIERRGIGLNHDVFDRYYPRFDKRFNVQNNTIYSSYNLYNPTARPSCAYSGLNFISFKKADESRRSFVPENDLFVEFDYKSYQVKLLADLLDYDFAGENPHDHLNRIYFGEGFTPEQAEDGKKMTFRYLYGRDPEAPDIEFFQHVYALRDKLWGMYQRDGFVYAPGSGRMIRGITEITQILPYIMQCHETERNVQVLSQLNRLLSDSQCKTKVVLYTYDAFLFDFAINEGFLIDSIESILEEGGYKTSMSYGYSYGELEKDC